MGFFKKFVKNAVVVGIVAMAGKAIYDNVVDNAGWDGVFDPDEPNDWYETSDSEGDTETEINDFEESSEE